MKFGGRGKARSWMIFVEDESGLMIFTFQAGNGRATVVRL